MSLFKSNATGRLAAISHDSLSIVVGYDRARYGPAMHEVQRAVQEAISAVADETQELTLEQYDTTLFDTEASIASVDPNQARNFVVLYFGIIHEVRHAVDLPWISVGQEAMFRLMNCHAVHPINYFEALVEHVSCGCGDSGNADWQESVDDF